LQILQDWGSMRPTCCRYCRKYRAPGRWPELSRWPPPLPLSHTSCPPLCVCAHSPVPCRLRPASVWLAVLVPRPTGVVSRARASSAHRVAAQEVFAVQSLRGQRVLGPHPHAVTAGATAVQSAGGQGVLASNHWTRPSGPFLLRRGVGVSYGGRLKPSRRSGNHCRQKRCISVVLA